MKLTVLQENLAKGLATVSRAVASRSTLPVLANVLLATDNGRLKISATNLELALTAWVGAKIEDEGSVTVPAKTIIDLVSSLSDAVTLLLDAKTQTLKVSTLKNKSSVKGIDSAEFPLVPVIENGTEIALTPSLLRSVAIAAATDNARPVLTGIHLVTVEGELTLEAADGHKLARSKVSESGPGEAVVPVKAMLELARLIKDEPVLMEMKDSRVIFQTGSVELVSQLIEGNFPDLTAAIPATHTTTIRVTTSELLGACATAKVFARESANTVRIKVSPAKIQLKAISAETGDTAIELDAAVEGEPMEFAMNVNFLSDALSVIEAPNVAIETSSPTSPILIRGDGNYLYVCMPLHLPK